MPQSESTQNLVALMLDAVKFVDTFEYPISQSPPHIYVSALPFTPSHSNVLLQFQKHLNIPFLVETEDQFQWPASHSTRIRGWPLSYTYSHHGNPVVSESSDTTVPPTKQNTTHFTCATFSPDGKQIVLGSWDTIQLWSIESGKTIGNPFKGVGGPIFSLAFSPSGKQIVSGSWNIQLWDTESGEPIGYPIQGSGGAIYSIAFSPNGKQIVWGSWDIWLWNTESSEAIGSPLAGDVGAIYSVAFSPDGKQIVSGSWDIQLWNAESGEAIGEPFQGHTNVVSSVAFSNDGRQIVSGSWDHTIRLWSVDSGKATGAPLRGHTGLVHSVALSPNGEYIVSGSSDGTIQLWDAKLGQAISRPLQGHTDSVHSVAFSPDGKHIVSGSTDDTIRIWDTEQAGIPPSSIKIVDPKGIPADRSAILQTPHSHFTIHSLITEDGWVTTGVNDRSTHLDGENLFWIPKGLRKGLLRPGNTLMIGTPYTRVRENLSLAGTEWVKCWKTTE